MNTKPECEFYDYRIPQSLEGADAIPYPYSESDTVQSSTYTLESGDPDPDRASTEPSVAPDVSMSSRTKSKSTWRWACNDKGERKWCSAVPSDINTYTTTTILVLQKYDNGSLELIPCFPDHTGQDTTCHDPKKRSDLFAELTKNITTLNPSACLTFSSKVKERGTMLAQTCWPYRALQSLTNRFGLTDIRFRRVCHEIDIDNIGKGEHYQKLGTIIHKANNQSLDPREGGRLYEHVKIENAKITTGVGTEAPA
jgi:hypothetical protein